MYQACFRTMLFVFQNNELTTNTPNITHQTIYESFLCSNQQQAKTALLDPIKQQQCCLYFFIFKTITEMIAKKYSTSIYTEQATTFLFKQSSNFAIYFFKTTYKLIDLFCLNSSDIFKQKPYLPNHPTKSYVITQKSPFSMTFV